jgi:glycosyltransferase involved in cell wall biosynthesis
VSALQLQTFQNRRALEWLIREIWIPFKANNPQSKEKLRIIGATYREVEQCLQVDREWLNAAEIEAAGFVESYENEVSAALLFLSPTVVGAGIRVKLIEALACGACVAATEIDIESVEWLEMWKNVLPLQEWRDLRNALDVAADADQRNRLISAARHQLESQCSWDRYWGRLIGGERGTRV